MLKQELLAPATLDGSPQDDLAAAQSLAARAAVTLRDCSTALGPGQLDRVVLDDLAVEDLQRYLCIGVGDAAAAAGGSSSAGEGGGSGTLEALRGRPARRLTCIADVLGAAAASGPLGFAGACTAIIDPLLDALVGSSSCSSSIADAAPAAAAAAAPGTTAAALDLGSATLGGGLAVLHAVLAAVAAAPAETRTGEPGASHPLQLRAPRIVQLLEAVEQRAAALQSSTSSSEADDSQLALAAQAHIWALRLRLQLLLLASADNGLPLPQPQIDQSVQLLIQAALQLPSDSQALMESGDSIATSTDLWLDWDRTTDAGSEAMQAIETLSAPATSTARTAAAAAESSAPVDSPHVAACVRRCVEALLLPALRTHAAERALSVLQLLAGGEHGGAWQLLGWLHPLVVQELGAAAGDTHHEALLKSYLSCMHHHAINQLPLELSPQQAAEAAGMVNQLLDALNTRCSSAAAAQGDSQPVQLALLLTSRLTSRCSTAAQGPLLLSACEWITEAAAAAAAADTSSVHGLPHATACKAAMAAALLIGGTEPLHGDSMRDVAAALARVAVARGADSARAPAAVALGAVINKWEPSLGGSCGPIGAAAAGLAIGLAEPVLLPTLAAAAADGQRQAGAGAEAPQIESAVACIAWMGRGLAMLRSDAWQQLTTSVLDLLPSISGAGAGEVGACVAASTAGLFEVLVSDTAAGGSESWSLDARSSRLRTRPLWQQKAFVLALKMLSKRASTAAAAFANSSSSDVAWQQQALALAMASLLSSAPRSVYRSSADAVLTQLVPCMARVAEAGAAHGSSPAHEQRLHACLFVVSDFLTDPSLLPLAERDVDSLLQTLLTLVAWRARGSGGGSTTAQSAAVRETALQCLVAVMQVPYRLLHPHRRAVLRAITAALDDDRRTVRMAAVRARRVWSIN